MSGAGETIFALSSGRPPAAVAVVRVSGPRAGAALRTLAGAVPAPRTAALRRLRRPAGPGLGTQGAPIDDALVLWFPAPGSATGEDVAELQVHGGTAVVAAVLAGLAAIEGLRPAEPGEFTRRALENGKLDLTRVEGLADLIAAGTEAQRRQAFAHYGGALAQRTAAWRERLMSALALLEAAIDFADDGVDAAAAVEQAGREAQALGAGIAAALADGHRGERLREGMTVAIAGPVNVGKSSILNRLARRPAAIVSPHAGTTRDVIEVALDLGGFPLTVLDTAGIRETGDAVEQEGVARARARAADCDLVLWVVDARAPEPVLPPAGFAGRGTRPVWRVLNKIDAAGPSAARDADTAPAGERVDGRFVDGGFVDGGLVDGGAVSALTGAGFETLEARLTTFAGTFFRGAGEPALVTRARHHAALSACVDALARAAAEGGGRGREDIMAEELRAAAAALGRLAGRVDVEQVLDVVFREFCIGK